MGEKKREGGRGEGEREREKGGEERERRQRENIEVSLSFQCLCISVTPNVVSASYLPSQTECNFSFLIFVYNPTISHVDGAFLPGPSELVLLQTLNFIFHTTFTLDTIFSFLLAPGLHLWVQPWFSKPLLDYSAYLVREYKQWRNYSLVGELPTKVPSLYGKLYDRRLTSHFLTVLIFLPLNIALLLPKHASSSLSSRKLPQARTPKLGTAPTCSFSILPLTQYNLLICFSHYTASMIRTGVLSFLVAFYIPNI